MLKLTQQKYQLHDQVLTKEQIESHSASEVVIGKRYCVNVDETIVRDFWLCTGTVTDKKMQQQHFPVKMIPPDYKRRHKFYPHPHGGVVCVEQPIDTSSKWVYQWQEVEMFYIEFDGKHPAHCKGLWLRKEQLM